jgi:hypothetical protein
VRYSGRVSQLGQTKSRNNMKTNTQIAVLLGLTTVAAIVLSLRSQPSVETVIGYASVLALLGVAASEYRIRWRQLFGRN